MTHQEKMSAAIKHWAYGLLTIAELFDIAKGLGYKLEREGNTLHASKGWASFAQRLDW